MSHAPSTSKQAARRGVAFLLVLIVVAGAAVMGWAMLSASSMRAQADLNTVDGVDATSLAESGANLAVYYLRYPAQSPVPLVVGTSSNSHYPGQNNLTLWSGARGTVDITVTNPRANVFRIASVANVPARQGGATVRRTVVAFAKLTSGGFRIDRASYSNGNFDVPSNMIVTGDLTSAGTVTVATGGVVSGTIYASNGGAFINGQNATVSSPVPAYADLQAIKDTATRPAGASANQRAYTYNGVQYFAERLSVTVNGTRGPSATNPLGIFFAEREITLRNATINGTVVIRDNNNLVMRQNVTITPATGMPALVTGSLDIQSTTFSPSNVVINGVTWMSGGVTNTASTTTAGSLTINGALMFASGATGFNSNVRMPIALNFNATNTIVPTLAGANANDGITVTGWSAQ